MIGHPMPRPKIAFVVALVLFAVGLVLNLVSPPIDPRVFTDLLFGGLTALAAGFVL